MLWIKIVLIILALIGLLISLGQMLGWFRDADRVALLRVIEKDLKCHKDHPGAMKFINRYLLKNPEYKQLDINANEIAEVAFVGNWHGQAGEGEAKCVDAIFSGVIKLRSTKGDVTRPLCSYEELKDWSRESPFWKWFGWGLVATSILLSIVLLVLEEMAKSNG